MIGERLSDRYEILEELGRGGMGAVYRARDPFLDRDVAVKVISLDQISSEAEERFRREAQLVGQMDHPGIVPIFDLGAHQDFLFFVMPVVEGTTLQSLLRRRLLQPEDTIEIVAQVAEALDYSHARGVVHRDVKPENVMVTRENTELRARVMDFGLALVGAASRLTRTGKLPGTLVYLSPEQILSAEIDGRSDLYSLGSILYECLTGGTPFSGSRYSLLYRIAHEPPPPLEAAGVDGTLAAIVLSCLAKRPEDRPARGQDLADALRRYREDRARHQLRQAVGSEMRSGSVGGPGVTPLAGRARETAELRRRLDEALQGGCRFVTIGAEAGLGKTRLLRYVEEMARNRGDVVILRGRFSAEDTFPYQGFGELVQDYFRPVETGAGNGGESPDLSDLGADLLTLFPVLHEVSAVRDAARGTAGPALSVEAAVADHTHIYELLARTLTRLADGRPLLLLLEQLHASETSIEALQYIVRRLGPTPTLIVGTYRPSETEKRHPLGRLLRGMKDDPRTSSLVLEPLSPDEHRELLATLLAGSEMSTELVDKLYSASEGNPFFIQEWVRWLLETGEVGRDDDGTWRLSSEAAVAQEALPETIQQAVEARLEQLPDQRLETLRTASVLGPGFDFADLEALLDCDADRLVDELLRDGLLEEDARSREDRLLFSSSLVRKTLYKSLPRRRRRLFHRRHAESLEARYAPRLHLVYARLVHHFAAGDAPEPTVRYALEMARSAHGSLGWEAAIRAVRTALEFVEDEAGTGNAEGELRRLLAAALRSEGQLETALKEAVRAVRVSSRAGDGIEATRATLLAAEVAWQRRKIDATRKWVAQGSQLARIALQDGNRNQAGGESGLSVAECLRRLLVLDATLANLGGEYARARALRDEAETLWGAEEDSGVEPAPAGGTLVVSLPNPLSHTVIAGASTAEEVEVLSNVFETLLKSDAAGNLIPTLCQEWEGAARGRIFRFTLRREVCFSDGAPLLAADVKRSFEYAVRRSGELPAPALRALDGIEAFLDGTTTQLAGVVVKSDRVVEFRLRDLLPIFPALLTDPRTAVTRQTSGAVLGTGPFRWPAENPPQAAGPLVLERNPKDWRRRGARLDRLEFRILPEAFDAARALRAGEIDLARDLRSEEAEEILRDPRFRSGLVEVTQKNVLYVLFNCNGPICREHGVRRALIGQIRVRDLVWRTLGRFAQPATGMIPPGVLGHDPGRRHALLSRDAAAALLESTGLELPIVLRGAVHPHLLGRYEDLIDAVREAWAELGVDVELETLPPSSYQSRAADPTGLDFCFGRWTFAYDDPDNFAYEMLHSRHGRVARYLVSGDADPLLERARQEVRASHRQRLYHKIEALLADRAILLPLLYDVRHGVRSPRLLGLRLLATAPFVNYAEVSKTGEDGPPHPGAQALRHSGTLHVPLAAAVPNLDPCFALMTEGAEVVPTVFETLTTIDEGAHVVPRLAAEFRLEESGYRYRFRLRQNVRFHDGRRLSVRDVRYSFERLLRQPRPGAETPLLPIRGAHALRAGKVNELKGFRVVSEREFTLDLKRPLAFFPAMLTSPSAGIVPEGTEVFDSNWRHGTAGTGPFRVVRLIPGERLELEAHPHYWRTGYPTSDRLIFEFGVSAERIAEDFRDGKLDLACNLRPTDLEDLRRDPALAAGYREAPGFSTYYLIFNSRRGAFADRGRRRALASLLNAEAVVRSTLARVAVAAHGLIPPGLPGQVAGRDARDRTDGGDPALLAGLEVRCALHPAYLDTYRPFWLRLVETVAGAGMTFEILPRDVPQKLSADGDVDLFATRWMADYPDSDTFVHLLHSREGIDGALCGDAQLDRLIEQGRRTIDPASRDAVYREIERRIREEAFVIPLFHESVYRFARPEVTGLRLGMRSPVVAYEELGLAS